MQGCQIWAKSGPDWHKIRVDYYLPCTLYLSCAPPLLEVALRQISPLLSVFCFSSPCSSQPLLDIIISPPSFWSSLRSISVSYLPLCASNSPTIVLHRCYMSCHFPFQFSLSSQNLLKRVLIKSPRLGANLMTFSGIFFSRSIFRIFWLGEPKSK